MSSVLENSSTGRNSSAAPRVWTEPPPFDRPSPLSSPMPTSPLTTAWTPGHFVILFFLICKDNSCTLQKIHAVQKRIKKSKTVAVHPNCSPKNNTRSRAQLIILSPLKRSIFLGFVVVFENFLTNVPITVHFGL